MRNILYVISKFLDGAIFRLRLALVEPGQLLPSTLLFWLVLNMSVNPLNIKGGDG
jgi:hypothetical protein